MAVERAATEDSAGKGCWLLLFDTTEDLVSLLSTARCLSSSPASSTARPGFLASLRAELNLGCAALGPPEGMRFAGGGCPPPAGREDITYATRDIIDREEPRKVEKAYVRGKSEKTPSSAGSRDAKCPDSEQSQVDAGGIKHWLWWILARKNCVITPSVAERIAKRSVGKARSADQGATMAEACRQDRTKIRRRRWDGIGWAMWEWVFPPRRRWARAGAETLRYRLTGAATGEPP